MRRIARRPHLATIAPASFRQVNYIPWHIGLKAARLLRRDFPEFWADEVAGFRVTEELLLGAGAALIRLVSQEVELDDWFIDRAGVLGGGPPAEALQLNNAEDLMTGDGEDAWDLLEEFISNPPLAVYGVNLNEEEGYEGNNEPLAMALQWITLLHAFDDAELAQAIEDENLHITLTCDTPRVECRGDDRLGRLCAALDEADLPTWRGVSLGKLLAYAHQRTDNPFANVGYLEAYDIRAYGAWDVDWESDGLAILARQQDEARRLHEAFNLLERHILSNDIYLIELGETIARVAATLGLPVYWPGADDRDENEEPHDDDTDDTEAEALAAA